VVVGTHRLLSKDVHFKDLGLLIVDEEQRFGVTHKERIKQLRAQLDVLTLSATPIPRTLQMAVSGMRDLSLITTAPVDRRAVRTVVSKDDPQMLKDAVQRELAAGARCFSSTTASTGCTSAPTSCSASCRTRVSQWPTGR
jgi:transcription-repair coupling factor (superfamily II helicase)